MKPNTRQEQIEIANIIIQQMGGNKFKVMTGAKNFFALAGSQPGCSFEIPGTMTKNKINRVKIILDPSDTYTVSFWNFRINKTKKISEYSVIYDDQLQDIFEKETGLYTHL